MEILVDPQNQQFCEKFFKALPLHIAVENNQVALLHLLIHFQFSPESVDKKGRTPLHLAAKQGNLEAAQFLIGFLQDLNIQDNQGNAALHYACTYGQTKIVQLLVENEAKKDICNNARQLPIVLAQKKKIKDILRRQRLSIITHFDKKNKSTPSPNTKNGSTLATSLSCLISDFKIIKKIGNGSYGEVFLAKRCSSNSLEALKIIDKQNLIDCNLFHFALVEKEILKGLDHPFIAKMNTTFQSSDSLYISMEYCAGGGLYNQIQRFGKLKEKDAKKYLVELILALGYLHENGIVYRDLKPGNVMLDSEGHIKLIDFGLSCKENQIQDQLVYGTPHYIAPEMLRKHPYGCTVDWFSLGVLFYVMLSGHLPFLDAEGKDNPKSVLKNSFQPPDVKLSKHCVALLKKVNFTQLLRKNPNRRIGKNGPEEVKAHKYFRKVQWDLVLERRQHMPDFQPPTLPNQKISRNLIFGDLYNFESEENRIEGWSYFGDSSAFRA